MIRVALLWHMHQPLYKEPLSGEYRLPWTRMHALKDYFGMVRLASEFPRLRLTFNLVPSLVIQLQDYSRDDFREAHFELIRAPVGELDSGQRQVLVRHCFQNNHQTMVSRYPRFKELLQKYRSVRFDAERALRLYSDAELRDLQVLSQLVWFDEYFLAEEPARSLAAKGRDFSLEDQKAICAAQPRLIAKVLEEYRSAHDRGQVELSTSAFFHPILPLICDTNIAAESRPDVHLPRERFRYPQDAREQLARARGLHEKVFGETPVGLWPSEGSVSDEVLRLASEMGFRWAATDEQVLARTLALQFVRDPQGAVDPAETLYRPYVFTSAAQPLHLFFRDHQLSDLIGFVYSQLAAEAAADDFIRRIRATAKPPTAAGRDALLTIILDGENAWEYYPDNGRPFLRALYSRLTGSADITTCTFSEATRLLGTGMLRHVVPGSWINANFDIWIGAEEDNRSWDQLTLARTAFEQARRSNGAASMSAAYDALLAAEGSDWNWWYGPEHHSENEPEFDSLYRAHLTNAYQSMGKTAPSSLLFPITHAAPARVVYQAASGWIHPQIDGRVSSYFEWLGAAMYQADMRTSTMHGKQFAFSALCVGYDADYLYTRLDFARKPSDVSGEIRFEIVGERTLSLLAAVTAGKLVTITGSNGDEPLAVDAALDRIFEMRIARASLGETSTPATSLRVAYWSEGLPREILPSEGTLEITFQPEQALVNSW